MKSKLEQKLEKLAGLPRYVRENYQGRKRKDSPYRSVTIRRGTVGTDQHIYNRVQAANKGSEAAFRKASPKVDDRLGFGKAKLEGKFFRDHARTGTHTVRTPSVSNTTKAKLEGVGAAIGGSKPVKKAKNLLKKLLKKGK